MNTNNTFITSVPNGGMNPPAVLLAIYLLSGNDAGHVYTDLQYGRLNT
jgi:hypothetical protein